MYGYVYRLARVGKLNFVDELSSVYVKVERRLRLIQYQTGTSADP